MNRVARFCLFFFRFFSFLSLGEEVRLHGITSSLLLQPHDWFVNKMLLSDWVVDDITPHV